MWIFRRVGDGQNVVLADGADVKYKGLQEANKRRRGEASGAESAHLVPESLMLHPETQNQPEHFVFCDRFNSSPWSLEWLRVSGRPLVRRTPHFPSRSAKSAQPPRPQLPPLIHALGKERCSLDSSICGLVGGERLWNGPEIVSSTSQISHN